MLRDRLARPVTPPMRVVHLLLGAVMPPLLLVFDPVVFRHGDLNLVSGAFLGRYRAFGYFAVALALVLLIQAMFVARVSRMEVGSTARRSCRRRSAS